MNGFKFARLELNYSMQDLAQELGVTKQTIYKWENEMSRIPKKRLQQLEELYGVPVEYFQREITKEEEFTLKKLVYQHSLMKEIENSSEVPVIIEEIDEATGKTKMVKYYPEQDALLSQLSSINNQIQIEERIHMIQESMNKNIMGMYMAGEEKVLDLYEFFNTIVSMSQFDNKTFDKIHQIIELLYVENEEFNGDLSKEDYRMFHPETEFQKKIKAIISNE